MIRQRSATPPRTIGVHRIASQSVIAAVRFMQVEPPQYVRLIPQEMEPAMRKTGIHAIILLEVHMNVQCSRYCCRKEKEYRYIPPAWRHCDP